MTPETFKDVANFLVPELDVWALKLMATLQELPQFADVTSDQQANAATATLTIDRDRAARFGIQPTLINATIYDAIGQNRQNTSRREASANNPPERLQPDQTRQCR